MKTKFVFTVVCGFLFLMNGFAQPKCTLGIGGKDAETIKTVFQLNDDQLKKMEGWQAELAVQTKLIEDEMKQLTEKHPQSTEEELAQLAKKYRTLQNKMLDVAISFDEKLIATFNKKQYQFYEELCNEAVRKPLGTAPE